MFTWVIVVINIFLVLFVLPGDRYDCADLFSKYPEDLKWCEKQNSTYKSNTIVAIFFVNLLLWPIWFNIKKRKRRQSQDGN